MTFVTIPAEIERDRFGRPLVIPPGGGKPTPYTRATSYVSCLEDLYNLQQWQLRQVLLGLLEMPGGLLDAEAHRDDKAKLNRIAEDAIQASKARAAATIGTAIHALCHRLNRGESIGSVPGGYQGDLDAYLAATKILRILHSETFTVLDELKIGGTPDQVVEYDGERYIADIKTGSIEYGIGKIAMQLAVYAHSQLYDIATGTRTPLPGVNGQRGIVIHLPAGTGTCTLHWVDIAAGWDAVNLATGVRAWRARKGLSEPFVTEEQAVANLAAAGLIDPLVALIDTAASTTELNDIWACNQSIWTDAYTQAAATRKAQLSA